MVVLFISSEVSETIHTHKKSRNWKYGEKALSLKQSDGDDPLKNNEHCKIPFSIIYLFCFVFEKKPNDSNFTSINSDMAPYECKRA